MVDLTEIELKLWLMDQPLDQKWCSLPHFNLIFTNFISDSYLTFSSKCSSMFGQSQSPRSGWTHAFVFFWVIHLSSQITTNHPLPTFLRLDLNSLPANLPRSLEFSDQLPAGHHALPISWQLVGQSYTLGKKIDIVSVLHQNEGGIGKSIPDAQEGRRKSRGQRGWISK